MKVGSLYANSVNINAVPLAPSKMPDTEQKHEIKRGTNTQNAFGEVFSKQLEASKQLQFSKHATGRLNSREIALSDAQLERVESGVVTARAKGINDSLVLVDEVALVVNTLSKTVITIMERGSENVFTNIDGAVIV